MLKRNLNIIFADGFAVILLAIPLPVFYQYPLKKFTPAPHKTE